MTWIDVVKEQLAKLRKEGKSPSIGDVTPAARKEWDEIKSGKHPLYSQGSSKGKKRSSSSKKQSNSKQGKQGKNKTQKMHVSTNNSSEAMDHRKCIEQMLAKVHLCKKDVGKIHKYLKTMKMQKNGVQKGGDCGCSQSGGSGSCSSCQAGGKGKKGRRTMKLKKGKKGKKGKKSMKGGEAHEEDAENDNDNADDTKAEEKDSFISAIDEETGEYGSGESQKVAIVRDED